jgi:hypothetical protein
LNQLKSLLLFEQYPLVLFELEKNILLISVQMNLNMDLTRIKNRKIRNECEINLIVLMKGYKVLWLVDQLHGKQLDILKQEETFPIKRKYFFFFTTFRISVLEMVKSIILKTYKKIL